MPDVGGGVSDSRSQSGAPSIKVCGGCGRPVDDSSEIGALYWCEWVLAKVPVRIKRTPLWKEYR